MSAGEIASKFKLTNATISYHLSQLKQADLIHEKKVKNFIYYELNTTVLDDLILWVKLFSKEEI
jgi:DNA-binding transcriptional ArsR family regulator